MRRLSTRKKLAFSAITLSVIFCTPELILRAMLFQVEVPRPSIVCAWNGVDNLLVEKDFYLEADRHCFYDLRAGAQYVYMANPMDVLCAGGFRGKTPPGKAAEKYRIVCLGDSSTFGMCVEEPKTWCRQLEHQLTAEQVWPVEVFNGGVIGYTVYQGLQKFRHKVRQYRPNLVILAFGAINEAMPAEGPSDLERSVQWQQRWSEYVDSPSRWIWKLRTVQLLGKGLLAKREAERRALLKERALHMGDFEKGRPYKSRMTVQEFRETLCQLIDEIHADGGECLLVNPHRRKTSEQENPKLVELSRAILDVAREKSVRCFDANALFRSKGAKEATYFADTFHLNEEGNRVLAESLARFMKDQRLQQQNSAR